MEAFIECDAKDLPGGCIHLRDTLVLANHYQSDGQGIDLLFEFALFFDNTAECRCCVDDGCRITAHPLKQGYVFIREDTTKALVEDMEDSDCLAVDNLVRFFIALLNDQRYTDAVADANLAENLFLAKLICDGIVHDCRCTRCKHVSREAIRGCNPKCIQIRFI